MHYLALLNIYSLDMIVALHMQRYCFFLIPPNFEPAFFIPVSIFLEKIAIFTRKFISLQQKPKTPYKLVYF